MSEEPTTKAGRVLDGYCGPAYRHIIVNAEAEAREQERARIREIILAQRTYDRAPYILDGVLTLLSEPCVHDYILGDTGGGQFEYWCCAKCGRPRPEGGEK